MRSKGYTKKTVERFLKEFKLEKITMNRGIEQDENGIPKHTDEVTVVLKFNIKKGVNG